MEYLERDVTPGSSYDYRIASFNEVGSSAWITVTEIEIPDVPPNAPNDLRTQGISNTEIQLNWSDNSINEIGFIVELSFNGSGEWSFSDSVAANRHDLIVDMLQAETDYLFRVCAFNESGNSGFSNEARGNTFPLSPNAPTDLSGLEMSWSNVNLSWTDNSDNEDSFIVERRLTEDPNWAEVGVVETNVREYEDLNVASLSTYHYRVCALNEGGTSDFSNEITVVIPAGPPPAPSGLSANAVGTDRIELFWHDNSETETEFQIERRNQGDGDFAVVTISGANTQAYLDSGLQMATTYEYRIKALDAVNGCESDYSNIASATTDGDVELVNESFENYDVGNPPPRNSGWQTLLGGDATLIVSDQRAVDGNKSALINDLAGSIDNSVVFANEHRAVSSTRVSFSMYFTEWGEYLAIRGGDNTGNLTWEIAFRAGAEWAIRDSDGWRAYMGSGVSLRNWMNFEIISQVATGTSTVVLNGVQLPREYRFMPGDRESLSVIAFISFASVDGEDSPWENLFIDNIIIEEEDANGFIIETSKQFEPGTGIFDTSEATKFGPLR